MKRTIILTVFALSVCAASAQNWYSSPANNGRDINCIKLFNRDSVIVAGGWKFDHIDTSSAIFLSHIGGLYLWNVPPFPDIDNWITSIDFTDSQNGIAVGNGGVIVKTSDGGENWTSSANAPLNRDLNKIYLVDAQNMFLVGGRQGDSLQSPLQTIYKSTNGGQSWNVVLDQPGQWLKSVYFPTPTTGYAVGDSGTILKSTDSGAHWNPVTAPLQRNFNSIWFTDANNGFIVGGYPANDSIQTILQTTNGGNTWTIKFDRQGGMLRDIHFADANTGYAVGDYANVFKTTNGGQVWNPVIIPGTTPTDQFNAVRFYSPDFGYISGKWGVQFIYNEEATPEAITSNAELVDTQVILHGFVNSNNEIAAYKFIYSYESDFSNTHFESYYAGLTENNTYEPVQEVFTFFTNILPDTTYYYAIEAYTLGGIAYGDTFSFFTGTSTAEIKTLDATNITNTGAQLSGTIRGYNVPVNLFFEYGTTPGLGSQVAANPASVNDTALQTVTGSLLSLQPYTFYYYRLKGVNGPSNYLGNVKFFFTGADSFYNALHTLPATDVLDTSAILNGYVDGFKMPATISFEYSDNLVDFNHRAPVIVNITDSLSHNIDSPVYGLAPNALYYFRIKAETQLGTFYGDTLAFYTYSENPNVVTLTATGVTTFSAQLNGLFQKMTQPITNIVFEYGTTLLLGNTVTATPVSINDTLRHDISATMGGLQDNTMYYYRLKGETGSGTKFYGGVKQLYTGVPTIPNWDFQRWSEDTVPLPKVWNIFGQDFSRVPGHSGDYAMELRSPSIFMLGIVKAFTQNGVEMTNYVPFNYHPDSIVVWIKCDIKPNDTLPLYVFLKNQDLLMGHQTCKIAGSTGGVFKRMAFPIEYHTSLIPDSLALLLIVALDNVVTIDDISFTPAPAPPVPNGDFESWFDYDYLNLSDWKYLKFLVIDTVSHEVANTVFRTYFNAPSDYAAELKSKAAPDGSGGVLGAVMETSSGILGSPPPSFAVHAAHRALNGYFQYYPVNGDTMKIGVMLTKNGQMVGSGTFLYGDTVDQFQQFEVPINYFSIDSTGVPDSAFVSFSCSKDSALGASRLIIDKLSFDGIRGDADNVAVPPLIFVPGNLVLYPNPATSTIIIQLETETQEQLQLEIYNMEGRRMYFTHFTGKQVEVPVNHFPKGIYMAQVFAGGKKVTGKFIVIK